MKRIVQQAFVKLHEEQRLNLKENKKKLLIDFVASIPAKVTKAATRKNIQHGFIVNSLVDETHKHYPDFNKILATCRKNPKTDNYNHCVKFFSYLFNYCLEHGHVPDLKFELLGFHQDINIQGNYVQRYSTITQESRQRAKCLTDEYKTD